MKISTFGALVILGALLFQGVSSAHHPEIEATPVCFSATTARITVTASAWVTPEPEHRINNSIEITIAGQVFDGAFTDANGYQFSGTVDVPANGATYTARATALAPWGPNGEFAPAGDFRETTVTVPNECVEGPSTTIPATTIPPTTIPATTIPPTTAPPTTAPVVTTIPATTIPATTAPSTTAPTTSAPATVAPASTADSAAVTTTIPVEVQGITETRADILARTGTSTVLLMVFGSALVLAGAVVELSVRRRRHA